MTTAWVPCVSRLLLQRLACSLLTVALIRRARLLPKCDTLQVAHEPYASLGWCLPGMQLFAEQQQAVALLAQVALLTGMQYCRATAGGLLGGRTLAFMQCNDGRSMRGRRNIHTLLQTIEAVLSECAGVGGAEELVFVLLSAAGGVPAAGRSACAGRCLYFGMNWCSCMLCVHFVPSNCWHARLSSCCRLC